MTSVSSRIIRPTLVLQNSEKQGNHAFIAAEVTSQKHLTPYNIRT